MRGKRAKAIRRAVYIKNSCTNVTGREYNKINKRKRKLVTGSKPKDFVIITTYTVIADNMRRLYQRTKRDYTRGKITA